MLLVANKIDLAARENADTEKEGKELADKNDFAFYQISVMTKIELKEVFVSAVNLYMEKFGLEKDDNHFQEITKKEKNKNGT